MERMIEFEQAYTDFDSDGKTYKSILVTRSHIVVVLPCGENEDKTVIWLSGDQDVYIKGKFRDIQRQIAAHDDHVPEVNCNTRTEF